MCDACDTRAVHCRCMHPTDEGVFLKLNCGLFLVLVSMMANANAAMAKEPVAAPIAPVVMFSDIHFDPFHDPAKFKALEAAPVTEWAGIFAAAPSPTQAADFEKLQVTCKTKGVDTPVALLDSSMDAAQKQMPTPLFVTLSGDLMAHKFDCRFHTLDSKGTDADYSAFAAKTVAFVAWKLRKTFPHVPVYIALGNNDSGCQDYSEDPNSAFLTADAKSFAAEMATQENSAAVLASFPELGDANVSLPMPKTRLLVLQDIFESKRYATCGGKSSDDAAKAQIAWLKTQLTAARKAHEKVWVMAHIPPGIDAYSTFTKFRNVCGGKAPEPFLASEALAETLAEYPDVIKLALFGHTHMDEMRVYTGVNGESIPGKLVPSISPVNGNNPAFTVAEVDTATATLKDYTVYSAVGSGDWDKPVKWTEEYQYSKAYGLPDFSGPAAAKLIAGFGEDKAGSAPASAAYEQFYFVGDPHISGNVKAAALKIVWPAYACALSHASAAEFRSCMCPAK
jgi:sphingomyelin phosphodiesterase acid-like 3